MLAAPLAARAVGSVRSVGSVADDRAATLRSLEAASARVDSAVARLDALEAPPPPEAIETPPSRTGLTAKGTCWYEVAGEWSRLERADCSRLDVDPAPVDGTLRRGLARRGGRQGLRF